MRVRRVAVAVVFSLVWVATTTTSSFSATSTPATQCSAEDYTGDARLGPAVLPSEGPVGREVLGYDRLAGLTPDQFIATYWDPTANGGRGGWRYPPADGFVIGPDGQPVEFVLTLAPGQQVDRFGSEFGAFLAPAGEAYAQRSIPPQSLDNRDQPGGCNYHLYGVSKPFKVEGGPIAAAFGQRGAGLQYLLVGSLVPGAPARLNVLWLVDHGYLQRVS